jgi:SAM-dependent methyltransferase
VRRSHRTFTRPPGILSVKTETLFPDWPVHLAPFDLGHRSNAVLQQRLRHLVDAYLRSRVTLGTQSDFDSRFYKASMFLLPFLSRNLPREPRRVLEIGCGKGAKSLPLSLLCENYCAVDIAPGEVEYARAAARDLGVQNVTFLVDEAANTRALLDRQTDRFDLIILYALLEHLTPDEKLDLLSAIWDYLDDEGILFIGEAPNRMIPVDYHSTRSLYFQQMPFDLWPYYLDRVMNKEWRAVMDKAIRAGDWRTTAYRRGVHIGHQEFDLALMPIEALEQHVLADNFDVSILNLYPHEYFEFLKLAELHSYRSFPSGVQVEPRRFPAFFSRYYLEVLLSKRARSPPTAALYVDRPYIRGSDDLFCGKAFVEVTAGTPLIYSSKSGAERVNLSIQIFEPMAGDCFSVLAQDGRVVAEACPKHIARAFARWRRHLAIGLPLLARRDFPIRVEVSVGKPTKVVGFVERAAN